MTIVDVEYEIYKCPHCEGYLVIRMQFPSFDYGATASLEHWDEIPDYLKDEEVLEINE